MCAYHRTTLFSLRRTMLPSITTPFEMVFFLAYHEDSFIHESSLYNTSKPAKDQQTNGWIAVVSMHLQSFKGCMIGGRWLLVMNDQIQVLTHGKNHRDGQASSMEILGATMYNCYILLAIYMYMGQCCILVCVSILYMDLVNL